MNGEKGPRKKERNFLLAKIYRDPHLFLWQEFPSLWRPLHSTMSQQHEMSSHYTPSHLPRHATDHTAPREEYPWYQEQNQLEEGRKKEGGRGERKNQREEKREEKIDNTRCEKRKIRNKENEDCSAHCHVPSPSHSLIMVVPPASPARVPS